MKILCISDAWLPQVNGVVRTYQMLQTELARMGHELRVIGPADFPVTFPLPGYAEIRLAIAPGLTLPRRIQKLQPDAIHIATEGPLGRAARSFCLQNKIPFTTCYHTHFPDYIATRVAKYIPPLQSFVKDRASSSLRRFHAPARRMMVATQSLQNCLEADGHAGPFHRFARGVNVDLFHPGDRSEFTSLPRPIALYVGRVAIEKSIEDFLSAEWAGSKVIVGDGPALNDLKSRYPEAVFCGIKTGEALAACYRSADVFAFPSTTDTFGIVLIEALASGLPVAARPVTGPVDIITLPELGALDMNFSQALHQALAAPGTPADRASHVARTYTWNAAASQFLAGLAT